MSLLCAAVSHSWLDWEDEEHSGSTVSVELMSHSFGAPFRYDSSYPNWHLSGSTIQTRQFRLGLILNPGISGRHGFLWNKKRLNSNEFDATLMLSFDEDLRVGKKKDSLNPKDQRAGIFFTSNNVTTLLGKVTETVSTADWSASLIRSGIDRSLGVPLSQSLIGLVVSPTDEKTGLKSPSVTLIAGNERVTARLSSKEQEMSVTHLSFLRLRLKVRPDSVTVLYQEYADWKVIAELTGLKNVPASGFLGISTFSGAEARSVVPFRTRVSSLHVKSYDLKAADENNLFTKHNLFDPAAYSDAISQTQTIKSLSKVVQEYMESTLPVYAAFRDQITALQKNVSEMDSFVTTLTKEARYAFKSASAGSGSEKVRALANEVKSIQSALSQIEREREEIMDHVVAASDEEDVGYGLDRHMGYYGQKLTSRGEEIQQMVEKQNRFTLILFLVVFTSAIVMGVMFYYRLNRYAQKAHVF